MVVLPHLCKKGGCFATEFRWPKSSLPSSQIRQHANLSACCVQGFLPSWVNVMYLNLHFLYYLLPETLVFLTKTMWHVLPLRTLMTLWLFDFPLLNFAEVRSGSLNLSPLLLNLSWFHPSSVLASPPPLSHLPQRLFSTHDLQVMKQNCHRDSYSLNWKRQSRKTREKIESQSLQQDSEVFDLNKHFN